MWMVSYAPLHVHAAVHHGPAERCDPPVMVGMRARKMMAGKAKAGAVDHLGFAISVES